MGSTFTFSFKLEAVDHSVPDVQEFEADSYFLKFDWKSPSGQNVEYIIDNDRLYPINLTSPSMDQIESDRTIE
jgi:hypothetical protein